MEIKVEAQISKWKYHKRPRYQNGNTTEYTVNMTRTAGAMNKKYISTRNSGKYCSV